MNLDEQIKSRFEAAKRQLLALIIHYSFLKNHFRCLYFLFCNISSHVSFMNYDSGFALLNGCLNKENVHTALSAASPVQPDELLPPFKGIYINANQNYV